MLVTRWLTVGKAEEVKRFGSEPVSQGQGLFPTSQLLVREALVDDEEIGDYLFEDGQVRPPQVSFRLFVRQS